MFRLGAQACRHRVPSLRLDLRVLGKMFVAVLSCHSTDANVSSLLLDCAFGGFLHLPFRLDGPSWLYVLGPVYRAIQNCSMDVHGDRPVNRDTILWIGNRNHVALSTSRSRHQRATAAAATAHHRCYCLFIVHPCYLSSL